VASVPNLHLITGAPALAGIDSVLRNVQRPERRLGDTLRPLASRFDDIIIDSPAGYSTLTMSVPGAATHLVIPTRAEYLSLESVAHFLRWYRDWGAGRQGLAAVTGILLTRVDHRRHSTREIIDIIRVHNRRGVFRSEIPEDPRAIEAPSHGVPLVSYRGARAGRAYERFAAELRQRIARQG
jgi:chromosome partitioning protein